MPAEPRTTPPPAARPGTLAALAAHTRAAIGPLGSAAAAAVAALLALPAAAADESAAPPPARPQFEGALAAIVGYGPEIPGADRSAWSTKPAFYLRWGRLSISDGGVAPPRGDDAIRGIGLDLVDRPRRRITLSLRYDNGRNEDASERLRGLGDVPGTLRVRLAGTWELRHDWRVRASWTVDALGRGGGNLGDLRLVHDRRLSPTTTLSATAGVTLAGDRHLQTYWGVNAEQAQRSGYPVYTPGMGLRDVSLGVGLRTEFHRHWGALAGVSVTRLLGPAADSPIVQKTTGLSANAGIVWRF